MKGRKIPPSVNLIHPGRRVFAAALDAVFTFALMSVIYFSLGRNVIMRYTGFYDDVVTQTNFIEDPGIVTPRSGGGYDYFSYPDYDETEGYGYQRYLNATWSYWMLYLPSHEAYEYAPAGYGKTQGAELIPFDNIDRHNHAQVGKWVFDNFYKSKYFEPSKDGLGNEDYTRQPSLTAEYKVTDESGKLVYARELRNFFYSYSNAETGAYAEAALNLVKQPKIAQYNEAIKNKQWMGFIPSIVVGPLVMLYLIPLLLPNGKTLGKLIAKGAVLNEEGFTAHRSQVALRQIIPTAVWFILLIPFTYVAVLAFFFAVAILYMFVVMNKKGQGLHDRMAGTIVINSRTSIWFASEEDMDAYILGHPNSLVARLADPDGLKKAKPSYAASKEEMGIFDASMIGKAREEAKTIESFDEFESREEERIEKPVIPPSPKTEEKKSKIVEEPTTTMEEDEERFTDEPSK